MEKPTLPTILLRKILETTFSKAVLIKRLEGLKTYLNHKLFSSDKSLESQIEPETLNWLQTLPPEFIDQFSLDNFQTLLMEMNKQVETLKTLIVYVAFEIPPEEIDRLSQSLRSSFSADFIIDIKFDPSLIAGPALVWNGVYRDYSLKSRIESNKEAIIASFRSFIK